MDVTWDGGEEKAKEEWMGYGMEGRGSREGDGGGNSGAAAVNYGTWVKRFVIVFKH